MRILRVATVPFFVLHHLRAQIEFLVAAGHEVAVVASPGEGGDEIRRMKRVAFLPVAIARPIAPLRDLLALVSLWRVMRQYRPQIVHSTTPKAGLLSAIAALLAGVPIRIHTFTGQAWATLTGPLRWIAKSADWLIVKLNTRCYADSPSQRRFMVAEGICREREVGVLGSGSLAGVDLERFDASRLLPVREQLRKRYGVPAEARVITFIGRVTRDKGIVELVTAFRSVREAVPSAFLLIVGPLEPHLDPLPGDILPELRNGPSIRAAGYDPHPESCLAFTEVLCIPSYREGFGNVVIEAAALGIPTVGTRIDGLRDAVVDGVTGVLVPPRDSAALADALVGLLTDDARRKRMGSAAQDGARRLFDSRIVNGYVLKEYERLLSARGS